MASRITIDPDNLQTREACPLENDAHLARLALRLRLATLAPVAPPACLLVRRTPAPYRGVLVQPQEAPQESQEAPGACRWTGPAHSGQEPQEAPQEAPRAALTWRTVLRVFGWASGLLPCLWVYYHVSRFGLRLLGEKDTD